MKEKVFLALFGIFVSLMTLYIHEARENTEPIIADSPLAYTEVVEIAAEKEYIPIDIPMDAEFQEWIYTYCSNKNVSPAIVIAIIEKESSYDPLSVGDDGESFGLMQIYQKFHEDRMEKLGVTDLLESKQNVQVGVDYLLELFSENPEPVWVLNAYNGGRAYANRKEATGEDTEYSVDILDRAAVLERMWEYAGN